ncbi:MAG: bacillithiol biosynthesis deacetylase BshB1 [Terriglobia bacterium]
MKLDLLAIAAHPDDAELTCGGTLAKMAAAGYQVGILDLTRGEMGTRGTAEIRAREAAAAAKALGVQHRENLGLADAHLAPSQENKLKLAARIRALRPHTVILPYWEARHPDHYHASHLAYEACFLAGLKQLQLEGQAFRPFKILYATMYDETARPSFVVDISQQFDRRMRAIRCYQSQFGEKTASRDADVYIPLSDLEERVTQIVRHYGQMIGVAYGEPFLVREVMQVDDIVRMPVRSL